MESTSLCVYLLLSGSNQQSMGSFLEEQLRCHGEARELIELSLHQKNAVEVLAVAAFPSMLRAPELYEMELCPDKMAAWVTSFTRAERS